jgi:Protein of unknown function (DUF2934)
LKYHPLNQHSLLESGERVPMWLIHQFDSLLYLGICKEYPTMAKAKTPRNTVEKTNGAPAAPSVTATPAESFSEIRGARRTAPDARKNIVPINLEEEIRRRAYELWEEHGRESGRDEEFWFSAEREVVGRYAAQRQQSA